MQPQDYRLRIRHLKDLTPDNLQGISTAELTSTRSSILDYIDVCIKAVKGDPLTDGYVETIRLCTKAKNIVEMIDDELDRRSTTFSTREAALDTLDQLEFSLGVDLSEQKDVVKQTEDFSSKADALMQNIALKVAYLMEQEGVKPS